MNDCIGEVMNVGNLLIVIDIQKGFINTKTRKALEIVEKAKKRLEYDVCVLTKFFNSDETSFSQFLHWKRFQTEKEQELAIEIEEKDKTIYKNTYSAVTDDLKSLICNGKYKKAYICGVETDSCVLATAFELFDNGVKPMIIIDGCASMRGKKFHKAAELIMRRSFGDENVKSLEYYLGGQK